MAAKPVPYRIINDRIRPDARGQLGGVRIEKVDGKRIVRMTPAQARWYLEAGAIELDVAAAPAEQVDG